MSNPSELPVFPPADIFPMLEESELTALAEDIKQNGLLRPIVTAEIDDVVYLVDGRNRRRACEIAGVEVRTEKLNGQDPTAFVVSQNIHRRHMTKSQRAMALAMIYPEPEKGGDRRSAKARSSKVTLPDTGFSKMLLSQARAVLTHVPDLKDPILNGSITLTAAYAQAIAAKKAAMSPDERLVELRKGYADIADRVTDGEITLDQAEAEIRHLEAEMKQRRATMISMLENWLRTSTTITVSDQEWLEDKEVLEGLLERVSDVEKSAVIGGAEAIIKKMKGIL